MTFAYRSNPKPLLSPSHPKATWLPSGEKLGEISRPGRAVRGTTLSCVELSRLDVRTVERKRNAPAIMRIAAPDAAAIFQLQLETLVCRSSFSGSESCEFTFRGTSTSPMNRRPRAGAESPQNAVFPLNLPVLRGHG